MDEGTKAEFETLLADSDRITVDPRALVRKLVRESRDCFDKGFMDKDGFRRTGHGARPSSSPSPSATPKPSRRRSTSTSST